MCKGKGSERLIASNVTHNVKCLKYPAPHRRLSPSHPRLFGPPRSFVIDFDRAGKLFQRPLRQPGLRGLWGQCSACGLDEFPWETPRRHPLHAWHRGGPGGKICPLFPGEWLFGNVPLYLKESIFKWAQTKKIEGFIRKVVFQKMREVARSWLTSLFPGTSVIKALANPVPGKHSLLNEKPQDWENVV